MRPLFPLTLIIIAALCFIAGYTVGKRNGALRPTSTPAPIAAEPIQEPIETLPAIPEETPPPAPVPVPIVVEPTTSERFASRAQQSEMTLTDTKERSLVAELIEASEKQLKVRRLSDGRILEVPVSMLCQNDQAFAAYLFQNDKGSKQSAPSSNADMIWDEIFKGM